MLTPLCQQVEALLGNGKIQNLDSSPATILIIQQIIMAINALSKTLDVMLQILVVFRKVESLRTKVTSFIHRMVETLGVSVFPYLPKALEPFLAEIELKELVGVLMLLNQLICKFNTSITYWMKCFLLLLAGYFLFFLKHFLMDRRAILRKSVNFRNFNGHYTHSLMS